MKLKIIRGPKTDISTIGDLFVNGVFACNTLEDKDRGLKQSMSLAEIAAIKVSGKTAIPAGIYEIVTRWSEKHQRMLPHLVNVTGFAEVEMHPGNDADDTLGCILVGHHDGANWISNSRDAFEKLFTQMQGIPKTEQIFITIT